MIRSGPRTFGRPAPPVAANPFDGVLLADKPAGPTSHDVVAMVRRHFGFDKVGHGGTLDPSATGLLILLIGRGTKFSERLMSSDKTYEGALRLGVATDTQDADGTVLSEAPFDSVTRERLEAEMARFRGDVLQTPPMVSAVKVDGVPLYKRARRGQEVERRPRLIHIFEFRMLDFEPPLARFLMRCTKGTYVRTVCSDIGTALGCGAHLANLRRTEAGRFHIEDALPLNEILRLDRDALRSRIVPIARLSS